MGFKLKYKQGTIWDVEELKGEVGLENSQFLINSEYSVREEILAVLDRIDFRYHKNFIIFGLRNIDLITEICKRKTAFSTVVIIEFSKNHEDIIIDGDVEKIYNLYRDDIVQIRIGKSDEIIKGLTSIFQDPLKLYNLRNIEFISMPYVKSMFEKELEEVADAIFDRLKSQVSLFGNSVEDILWGTDNYLNNWKYISKGLDYTFFENKYMGKSVVIVGAGPSLDKNIAYLKSLKGKVLIFCVDAAMDTLLDAGIIPDVVASIERTEVTTKFYKRDVIPESIVYVGPNIVPGSIFDRFNRIIFTGRTGDGLIRELNEYIGYHNLEIGANVAHILITFAVFLGCKTLIFAGLDLAYTGGKTHVKRVADDLENGNTENVYRRQDYLATVKGQNGELLETFEFFLHAKTWIEIFIEKHNEIMFINSTEGGANIEGAKNVKLVEAIERFCNGEVLEDLSLLYDEQYSAHPINRLLVTEKAIEFFTDLENKFNCIAKEAKRCYNRLNKYSPNSRIVLMEKLRNKFEDEIDLKGIACRFIIQSEIIRFNRDIHSFPMVLSAEEENRMLERSKRYYDTMNKVCRKVNETIEIYKKILNSYLEIYKKEEGVL